MMLHFYVRYETGLKAYAHFGVKGKLLVIMVTWMAKGALDDFKKAKQIKTNKQKQTENKTEISYN